ncbi:hypothetical protein Hanom_Chr10g00894971 [Helianthus anomalus]
MALALKNPHNYLCTLEKTSNNKNFHSIIDALSSSKYKTLLTYNTPIYQETLRDFWKNAKKCKIGSSRQKALGYYI